MNNPRITSFADWQKENKAKNKRCPNCHGRGIVEFLKNQNKPCGQCGGSGCKETAREQYEKAIAEDLKKWEEFTRRKVTK
jgi:DnaJ-class molecular chaperone